MKVILIILIYSSFSTCFSQSLKKEYTGFIEKCTYDSLGNKHCFSDSSRPHYKWYNKYKISIEGDSVSASSNSVSIYKKDTLYSESDGGFYYYKGTIEVKNDSVTIYLVETSCDYCPVQMNKDGTIVTRKKTLKGYLIEKSLFLEGQEFN